MAKGGKTQRACAAYAGDIPWVDADNPRVGRALSTRNLKPGDTFTPYVEEDIEIDGKLTAAPFAGLYRFNSDLKGNILVSLRIFNSAGNPESEQASYLVRSAICNFAGGAERIFFYCLRNNVEQKEYLESHFGLLNRDSSPKKSYWAVRHLVRTMLPGGSTVPEMTRRADGLYLARWTRSDGMKVAAVWSPTNGGERAYPLTIDGTPQVFGMVGNVIDAPQDGKITLKDGEIKFLVGAEVRLE